MPTTPASTSSSFSSSVPPAPFRPKAKVISVATIRKPTSSSALSPRTSNLSASPTLSRPASPLKPPWLVEQSKSRRITAQPTSRAGTSHIQTSLEHRQRALTSASPQLKLPHAEDRPRSGSVISFVSDTNTHIQRAGTPPTVVKVKSRVSGLVKATTPSPPYATTRPIHTRARTPSITTTHDPQLYPITTASPAANPHRYPSRRAPSPARVFPPSTDSLNAKVTPRVDPASVPLPPHSPPISALSLSSRSSVSRTSTSRNSDPLPDFSNVASRILTIERGAQPTPFLPKADTRRDRSRSRSTERSPRDPVHPGDCVPESDGPERQLRVEAKTNRKIADLEITNRSLLAINASLETTKNHQAKEIRDLRRKLRESRLVLPPRMYKAFKSAASEDENGRDDEEDDQDESDVEDESFQRVRGLLNSLIESGKRALETRSEDFRANLATKVLNADELRSWQDIGRSADETIQGHSSPACDEEGSTSLPPITITHSL